MSFIIQEPKNFLRYIEGGKVFVEGFIYRHNFTLTNEDKTEICRKLNITEEESQTFERVRFESVLILTVNDDQNIRATKIVVEACQIVGNREGIVRENRRVRQNIEKAIEISFEELSDRGAWGIEVGMLQQTGLKDAMENEDGTKVNWFRFTDDKLLRAVSKTSVQSGSALGDILDLMELAEA